MKIYLAGKISGYRWREEIVDGLDELAEGSYGGDNYRAGFPVMEGAITLLGQRHDFVGPYYAVGGHGETADDDEHGMLGMERRDQRVDIPRLCWKAIESADLVFAWIDDVTAYGTFAELGYAHAQHKRIIIGGPRYLRDLWFLYTLTHHFYYGHTARFALEMALGDLARHLAFEQWRPGFIYLLQMGEYYKIGRTVALDRRQRELGGTKLPQPIVPVHQIRVQDMVAVEAVLHRRYAQYRSNGEWFRLPERVVQEFCTLLGDG